MAGILDPKTGLLTQAPEGTTINETGIVNRPITSPTQQTQPVQAIPTPNTRSQISDTPQAGYIQGYDTNQNYKPVYVPKGVYVPGISPTPKEITTSSFQNQGTVKVPNIQTPEGQPDAMVAGGKATIESVMQEFSAPATQAQTMHSDFLSNIAGLTKELENKGVDQLSAEQSAGIPQLKTQFADINSQISTKLAEYNALQSQNKNRPVTMSSIIGSERAILDAKASDIGLLQAQAEGLRGQIQVAQETANRAVDLKYSTLEARLATYESQLRAIEPILSREEKQQAQAQQILLDRQKQEIADKKEKEKAIQSVMMKAIEAGITDSKILTKISQSGDVQEALNIAGPKIAQFVANDRALDIEYKKLQMANLRSEINNRGIKDKQVKIVKINGEDYIQNEDGTFSVPVIKGQTVNTAVTANLEDRVSQINKLITGVGTSGSSVVGPNVFGRSGENFAFLINPNRLTGKEQEFVAGVHQIAAQEFVQSILNMKKQGGTLGALNQTEGEQMRQAATKLNDWEIKDKNGLGTGKWNISESAFKRELLTIRTLTQRALDRAKGSNGLINNLEQNLSQHPERIAEYNRLVADNPGATDDEINQLMGF